MQLKIHSDTVTSPDAIMDRPRRSKRKTSESLPLENGSTPAKEKSSKKKTKKKDDLIDISEVSSPKIQENNHTEKTPITPKIKKDSKRKSLEVNGVDETPKSPKTKKTSESEKPEEINRDRKSF